ncbi:MAG: hypothetical protein NVS4B11_17910 [Ktedonobacteraceae bacterium]
MKAEVQGFVQTLSATPIPLLYGATDGKAVGIIAEYIWLKLILELASEQPTIALLCKTSVARNVLQHHAPLLWNYLTQHIQFFERRKSSIYESQAPFTMFGIGDYSFAPYKVAISGLHKIPRFRVLEPINGRPVMLDDTCYFVPCYSLQEATLIASVLNDQTCLNYINSIVFLDAKRPITKKLLQRIHIPSLLERVETTSR